MNSNQKTYTAVLVTAVYVILLLLPGCAPKEESIPQQLTPPVEPIQEVVVQDIPLAGQAAATRAEFSGLAWYGDWLVMLPQYPDRFGSGSLFALPKETLLQAVAGQSTQALEPIAIPFEDGGLRQQIQGFEGFECIVFSGDQVYLSIEAQPKKMLGYLVQGTVQAGAQGTFSIQLDPATLTEVQPQANLDNYSDESCIVYKDQLVTLYEANGVQVNPAPLAHIFDMELEAQDTLSLPNIEYRLTDASEVDSEGRFWAINYLFPGDVFKLKPAEKDGQDALAQQYGEGLTHSQNIAVERLVQFQIDSDKISMVDTPPIQLVLEGDTSARNWEGIVRFDRTGFLLVTDSFPKTLLGFVPYP